MSSVVSSHQFLKVRLETKGNVIYNPKVGEIVQYDNGTSIHYFLILSSGTQYFVTTLLHFGDHFYNSYTNYLVMRGGTYHSSWEQSTLTLSKFKLLQTLTTHIGIG